jgi:DNA-binding YbaB/EbfC family protein
MARGRGGMPGGGMPGGMDMGAMMKQVQKMQADMLKAQEELKDVVVDASAGGGMVKVTMSGDLELRSIEIDPDAVDPEDVEMLQDMVMAAINEALRAAQEAANNKMGGVTGDLGGLGGGLGLPGM